MLESDGLVESPDPSRPQMVALVLNHFCSLSSAPLFFLQMTKWINKGDATQSGVEWFKTPECE